MRDVKQRFEEKIWNSKDVKKKDVKNNSFEITDVKGKFEQQMCEMKKFENQKCERKINKV
jgi:hypothetical protein